MKQNKKTLLYEKFINQNLLTEINDINVVNKYFTCYFSILVFTGVVGLLTTMCGYNFEVLFTRIMFFFYILFLYISIKYYLKLIKLENNYGFFKKKIYMHIFALIPFALLLITSISAAFTTKVIPSENGFSTQINSIFFILIYVPLFIIYILILYYCVLRAFSDSIKNRKRERKQIKQ